MKIFIDIPRNLLSISRDQCYILVVPLMPVLEICRFVPRCASGGNFFQYWKVDESYKGKIWDL